MPVNRMRMRPWLVQMIESRTISGLDWIDEDKTTFTIPWKHAARHGWKLETDACLFQKWAIHTGKHTQGQAKDPKTWKANFRCALNSLPDIEEVKDRSVNKGHHAMRVFKMLPQASKSRGKRAKGKTAKTSRKKGSPSHSTCSSFKTDEDMDSSDTRSSADESALDEEVATQENMVGSSTPDSSSCYSSAAEDAVTTELQSLLEPSWQVPDNFQRFQVSPEHNTDEYMNHDIIEICKELERLENQDFRSICSPIGSQFSDSSVEDVDEMPLYTTLSTDPLFSSDWNMKNFL